jgi:hypothetical protein
LIRSTDGSVDRIKLEFLGGGLLVAAKSALVTGGIVRLGWPSGATPLTITGRYCDQLHTVAHELAELIVVPSVGSAGPTAGFPLARDEEQFAFNRRASLS